MDASNATIQNSATFIPGRTRPQFQGGQEHQAIQNNQSIDRQQSVNPARDQNQAQEVARTQTEAGTGGSGEARPENPQAGNRVDVFA